MEELEGAVLEEVLQGYAPPEPGSPNRRVPFKRKEVVVPLDDDGDRGVGGGGGDFSDDERAKPRPSLAPSLEATFHDSSLGEDDAVEFNMSTNPLTSKMAQHHAKRLTALYLKDDEGGLHRSDEPHSHGGHFI